MAVDLKGFYSRGINRIMEPDTSQQDPTHKGFSSFQTTYFLLQEHYMEGGYQDNEIINNFQQ